jgi:hypothetical protein
MLGLSDNGPDWRPYRGPRSLTEGRRHQKRRKAQGDRDPSIWRARHSIPCTPLPAFFFLHLIVARRDAAFLPPAADAIAGVTAGGIRRIRWISGRAGDGLRTDHGGADVRSCINAVYPTGRRGVRTNVRRICRCASSRANLRSCRQDACMHQRARLHIISLASARRLHFRRRPFWLIPISLRACESTAITPRYFAIRPFAHAKIASIQTDSARAF